MARWCAASLAVLGACGRDAGGGPGGATNGGGDAVTLSPQGKVLQASDNEDAGARSAARAPARDASTGERVDIPGGTFVAGSTPGDRGRDPTLEPALLKVELGGFSIDRLPYPNDPLKKTVTGETRAQAATLCQRAGGRLCTELEWERACKGPDGDAYAGGATWDAQCAADPAGCASGFGVLGMGALREWTASDVATTDKSQPKGAAVRGAQRDAAGVDHRCAHRASVDGTAASDDLGFRCCFGAPNAATLQAPQLQQTFRKVDLSPAQAREMFASVQPLEELGGDLRWFKEPDDVNTVLARGDAGAAAPNLVLTTSPLLWSPVPGEEVLVMAGRAARSSFIVAFYRLPDDRYRVASSLVLRDDKGPVVIAFNGYVRKRLEWATCWDCPAESGNITYREDNRVVITQK